MSQTEYRYHSLVKKTYLIAVFTLLLICFLIIRWKLEQSPFAESLLKNSVALVLSISVPLSIFIRLFLVVRPRIYSVYILGENKIIQRFNNKTKELSFMDIESVVLTTLPPRWFGGFKVKFKTGQTLVFLSLLEKNYEILQYILNLQPQFMENSKANYYMRSAKLVKNSWDRSVKRIRIWFLTLIKFILSPLLMTYVLLNKSFLLNSELSTFENFLGFFIIFLLSLMFIQIILTAFEEMFLNRLAKEVEGILQVPPSVENTTFAIVQVLFFSVVFLFLYFSKY